MTMSIVVGVRKTAEQIAAENVHAYRVLMRLNQEQLAVRVRDKGNHPTFTRQALSSVERGVRCIRVNELVDLAACLGVSVERLLDPNGPRSLAPVEDVQLA